MGTEYIEKGISFVNQKKYDNALECFNKHLEADSKNSIVLGLKALALMDLNRLDEALYIFPSHWTLIHQIMKPGQLKGKSLEG